MHVIAGKAVAFKVAATPEFKDRMQRTLDGAKILAERLMADDVKNNGISVLTGGTDVHLVMVDLRNSEMDGKQGEDLLAQCGITINRNTVPFDPRPASVASGLRIGTSALATRGFGPKEYEEVADIIGAALAAGRDSDVESLRRASTNSPKTSRCTQVSTRSTEAKDKPYPTNRVLQRRRNAIMATVTLKGAISRYSKDHDESTKPDHRHKHRRVRIGMRHGRCSPQRTITTCPGQHRSKKRTA